MCWSFSCGQPTCENGDFCCEPRENISLRDVKINARHQTLKSQTAVGAQRRRVLKRHFREASTVVKWAARKTAAQKHNINNLFVSGSWKHSLDLLQLVPPVYTSR